MVCVFVINYILFVFLTLGSCFSYLGRYFDEISQDTGKYCFGVDDTLKALELGAVEILICWENLDIMRYMLKIPGTEATKVLHLTPEQQKDNTHFTDKEVIFVLNYFDYYYYFLLNYKTNVTYIYIF